MYAAASHRRASRKTDFFVLGAADTVKTTIYEHCVEYDDEFNKLKKSSPSCKNPLLFKTYVNCHIEPRTKEGNDHECDSYRDCSARVFQGMQKLRRTPAMVRTQQANNRGGRNANRRDKAKMGGQGSRNATHEW